MSNVLSFENVTKLRPTSISSALTSIAAATAIMATLNATSAEAVTFSPAEPDPLALSNTSVVLGNQAEGTIKVTEPNVADSIFLGLLNKGSAFAGDNELSQWLDQAKAWSEAVEQAQLEQDAAIAEVVKVADVPNSNLKVITIEPDIDYRGAHPLSFAHVSGPIAIMREQTPDGIKTAVTAHAGIDTADHILTQVEQDPRGNHQIGEQFRLGDTSDIKVSENARTAIKFLDADTIEEMQIGVGYDMRTDRDIAFELIAPNGEKLVIDANQFQTVSKRADQLGLNNDTADYLAFVIKEDPEVLAAIRENLKAGGTFNVIAQSGLGREIIAHVSLGDKFEQHLKAGFEELKSPALYYGLSDEFKRRVEYDPNAPVLADHDAKQCIFLSLTEEQQQRAKIVLGEITDGTGIYPRTFDAHVALDLITGAVIALGEEALNGVNLENNIVRISGSANTTFTTSGGEIHNGCTDDYKVTIVPPTYGSGIPALIAGGNPRGLGNLGGGNPWNLGTPFFPGTLGTPFFPGSPKPFFPPVNPAPVGLAGSGMYLLFSLSLLDLAANKGRGHRGALNAGVQFLRRREDELEIPTPNSAVA